MIKNLAPLLFLLFFAPFVSAQILSNQKTIDSKTDTIVYNKNTNITEERTFAPNIKDRYTGKEFVYTEVEEKEPSDANTSKILDYIIFFMQSVFPFLLGGFALFIILKVAFGAETFSWKSTQKDQHPNEKLIYTEEDLQEVDIDTLLKQALEDNNFRLAIRYYYLATLKGLSNNNVIEYHLDKTNSEYLFEIKDSNIRSQFSYLSYVYSYVWYGEFPIDEKSFKVAQNKYQTFLNSMV